MDKKHTTPQVVTKQTEKDVKNEPITAKAVSVREETPAAATDIKSFHWEEKSLIDTPHGSPIVSIQHDFIELFKALRVLKTVTHDCKDIFAMSQDIKILDGVNKMKVQFGLFNVKFNAFVDTLVNNPAEVLLDHPIKGKIYWLNFYRDEFKRTLDSILLSENKDLKVFWGKEEYAIRGNIGEAFTKMTACYHEIWNHFAENGVHVRLKGIGDFTEKEWTSCNVM